ncbi:endolytic transglycosylase MltG [Streptomyces sp. LP11]|uniref:Endolytic murein transglycosylase n=1 Tax=Streptomyces pyxinicus TaxID=2970331 RepID=A0ABT2AZY5_9ACTN|nr:endolytic transglycosylase MltG [Streptomyces sp. LP11]MCS0601806.1 endolytic transglycosylase MltG [Streptomyces sp. LP11]
MTEYGRGPGSEPWHPQDPVYGDGGWEGQQAHLAQHAAYGGQPQQNHPQQPQPQYGDWNHGQKPGYGQQQHPYYEGQGHPPYDQQYAGHPQQQYQQGTWDANSGTHGHVPYAADPGDPYNQQPAAFGEQPDDYGTEHAYPPPQPPGRRRPDPEPRPEPGAEEEEHAFFAGGGTDEDEEHELRTRRERRGRKPEKKGKKRRTGCACMVVVVVFGGGLGGVGYFGYKFYQNRFGAAADYAGSGNGQQVTVAIPKGAGGWAIGQKLKESGVVESAAAFVSALQANPRGKSLQDGVYTLEKEMSAASAVELMLSPKSRSNLIIAEGLRNTAVYSLIDKRLEVSVGTTAKIAKKDYQHLGLPAWALNHVGLKDPLEGFLYPSSYAVTKGQKPEAVLKNMVSQAAAKYREMGLEPKAKALGLESPWQVLTVASLVQAEGTSHDDFRKMAEVVYNRLQPDNPQTAGRLEFDSTYNYVKNQSKIDLSIAELRRYNNPYNTYYSKGLPPGPIGNPGEEALRGALDPTHDGWYYFISMDGKTSKFTKTLEDHEKLVNEWNASRNKN